MAGSYEILQLGALDNKSVIFASAATRGLAVAVSSIDDNEIITGKLAEPTDHEVLGMLARDITVAGGPTLEDQVYNKGLESPDKAGGYTTVEDVTLFAIEGAANIDATHPITAAGDEVTFKAGKPAIAQTGEFVHFVVLSKIAVVVEGNTDRFILKRISSRKA
jgi:hypothetical protein